MSRLRSVARAVVAVASTTATELCGQPAVLLLLLAGTVLTALVPLLHFHDFGEPGRICRDSGLAYQLVIGTVVSVVAASASIHDEIVGGTALAALGKPISREVFLVGKWLGVMSVASRFWYCTLAAFLVAWRVPQRFADLGEEGMKYVTDSASQSALLALPAIALALAGFMHNRRKVRFCKTAISCMTALSTMLLAACLLFDRTWRLAPSVSNIDIAAVPVSVLVLMALAVYSAFAAALSTRLAAPPVLATCLVLIAAGLSWDAISSVSPFLAAMPVPNLQSFWMCDAIAGGGRLGTEYFELALAYSAASVAVALGAGMLLFRGRDLG